MVFSIIGGLKPADSAIPGWERSAFAIDARRPTCVHFAPGISEILENN